jgi:hypothetical protein
VRGVHLQSQADKQTGTALCVQSGAVQKDCGGLTFSFPKKLLSVVFRLPISDEERRKRSMLGKKNTFGRTG